MSALHLNLPNFESPETVNINVIYFIIFYLKDPFKFTKYSKWIVYYFFLGSGSSGSESDSEENSLAPPKLAPSNQENPIFNDLLKNLNNIKSSGKNEILTPAEITLKEEASIEYSSGKICKFMSGSCHLDRALNVKIGMECRIFLIVIFFNCARFLQFGSHSRYYKEGCLNSKEIIFSALYYFQIWFSCRLKKIKTNTQH